MISNAKPKVIVLSGYGLNCEEETLHAFQRAGAQGDIVHINDLIAGEKKIKDYQILTFPGGFSYGDDLGSGLAYANKLKLNLRSEILEFVKDDKLAIGICNGFQIMVNIGIIPALHGLYEPQVALTHNNSARYKDRWVDLDFTTGNKSVWTKGIEKISLPIAHGEGRFYADQSIIDKIEMNNQVAAKYCYGDICMFMGLEDNPNGSLNSIAGITDASGRLLGMMPHPERAVDFTHRPDWTYQKELCLRSGQPLPKDGPGLKIFQNGVDYFR